MKPHVGGYRYRALTNAQARAIGDAYQAGAKARDLAVQYGVSLRTIYRALDYATDEVVTVTVCGYVATFGIGELGPVRLTEWYPAEARAA